MGTYPVHQFDPSSFPECAMSLLTPTPQRPYSLQDNGQSPSLSNDLQAAQAVQEALFPRELPSFAGWELATGWRPARVVAGDYHDLFTLSPTRLALALGDVSGKGLGPALVTASLHAAVRSRLPDRLEHLGTLARELNAYLLDSTPADLYVTLFLGVLDVASGQFTYVNAGHPPPVLLTAEGIAERCSLLDTKSTVLGILPEAEYQVGQVGLSTHCLLALFSDGITEACNPQGEMFGWGRVRQALQGIDPLSAQGAAQQLLRALARFTHGEPLADDVSLVVVRGSG
jgi:sigma-B regulation protein RsbU (phosphoserine phosphatase)